MSQPPDPIIPSGTPYTDPLPPRTLHLQNDSVPFHPNKRRHHQPTHPRRTIDRQQYPNVTPPLPPTNYSVIHQPTNTPPLISTSTPLPYAVFRTVNPTPGTHSPGQSHMRTASPHLATTSTDINVLPHDESLPQSAVLNLTNIITSNHQENMQLLSQIRKEFCNIITPVNNSVGLLSEAINSSGTNQKITFTKLYMSVINAHDWIKAEVALQLLNVSKGSNILPHTSHGTLYSTVVMNALETVTGIQSTDDASELLNMRVQMGKYTLYIVTYLVRTSGCLHDLILPQFCNTFFASLPDDNLLSPNARVLEAQKQQFSRHVDTLKDYYRSKEYDLACKNACRTALHDILSVICTACQNICRNSPEYHTLVMPAHPPTEVSLYIFAFLVLKVCIFIHFVFNVLFTY